MKYQILAIASVLFFAGCVVQYTPRQQQAEQQDVPIEDRTIAIAAEIKQSKTCTRPVNAKVFLTEKVVTYERANNDQITIELTPPQAQTLRKIFVDKGLNESFTTGTDGPEEGGGCIVSVKVESKIGEKSDSITMSGAYTPELSSRMDAAKEFILLVENFLAMQGKI